MKIFIIGGGFAGLNAAKILSKKLKGKNEVYLIDRNEYTTMLPELPQIVSERFDAGDISEKFVKLLSQTVGFIHEEVTAINFDEKKITTNKNEYIYDYLILAAGSVTNYHGFSQNLDKVNILESLVTAKDIRDKFSKYIDSTDKPRIVISGAGFTSIELACNMYDQAKRRGKKIEVIFVELSGKILPMLTEKYNAHVLKVLHELNFKIYTENQVTDFDGKNVTLKHNGVIEDAFFCMCSGVKSAVKPEGKYDSLRDGRIIVDKFLSVPQYPEVYAVGDSAAIKDKHNEYLRRAVKFSEASGKHAAKNIAKVINGEEREEFKPVDLGWVIPMYISSVGVVLGKGIKGRKGIFMHYFMSGLKNYNFRNVCKEFWAALKYTFSKP